MNNETISAPEQTSKPVDGESELNDGLGLLDRIKAHIRQLAPHMMQREGVGLLLEAEREIEAWKDAAEKWDCATPEELKDRIFGLSEIY